MTTHTDTHAGAHYDPFDYAHQENPFPWYRRLRDQAPVFHNTKYGFWALSRYADCLMAARNWKVFSSAQGTTLEPVDVRVPIVINSDPPDHTRLRELLARLFAPQAVAPLEDAIRTMARALLAPHRAAGRLDVIQDYAARLPMAVICQLIGFRGEDEDMLRAWTDTCVHRDEGAFEMPAAGMQATLQLYGYFEQELARRAGVEPRGDIVATLMDAEAAGTLTHAELLGYLYILSIAGNETTTKLLANIAFQLHRHPAQRELVLADRTLIPNMIEETARFDGPTHMMARTTTADVELHGTTIPAGAKVALLFMSANHDERKFARADEYDIRRNVREHLAFGGGLHACLGAALARLELRVATEELLDAAPRFAVDETGLRRMHSPQVRGFTHVPIAFDAPRA